MFVIFSNFYKKIIVLKKRWVYNSLVKNLTIKGLENL